MEKENSMKSKKCTIDGCGRSQHAVGMCRPHRNQTLHGIANGKLASHTIGEVRPRVEELVRIYGTESTVATKTHVGKNTITRILRESLHAPVKVTAFDRIMNHQPDAAAIERASDTGASVAAYAKTPEGMAFVDRCRGPKARKSVAA